MRDQLLSELIHVGVALEGHGDVDEHANRAVAFAAPEHFVRVVLDEGPDVTRIIRAKAESLRTESGTRLALALGTPVRSQPVSHGPTVAITERERAVLRFLPSRLTNREIADECFMSVNTVKTHLKSIYAKLDASSRDQAVDRARRRGLL